MAIATAAAEVMGLRVANLELWLDARGAGIEMTAPACHSKFLQGGAPPEAGETAEIPGSLVLRVRNGPPPQTGAWRPIYYPSETWELWRDEAGRYVFAAPRQSPPRRHVIVDPGFGAGEVLGEFGEGWSAGEAAYPLQDIDMILFVNWLAAYGDLILHAAGVAVDGRGYGFAGASGAGKSTLAAALASDPSVAVLGEDQVILRCLDGRFWIFGTPWHENPARCSPRGAPLEKLFFLDRSAGSGVRPLGSMEGISRLLQTAFVPYYNPAAVAAILDRLALLAEQMPFYTLNFDLASDPMQLI